MQVLPDESRIAEGRPRLAALLREAERRGFKVLAPPALYWLAVSDYRQGELSRTSRNFRAALSLAESAANVFEARHAREALALYYSDLGELGPALAHAAALLGAGDLYYQSRSQYLRDKGTLADLTHKLGLFDASLSLSMEALSMAREISPADRRVSSNLRRVVNAAAAKGDFATALGYAAESQRLALGRARSAENTQTAAETYVLLADLKARTNDCEGALADYESALGLYALLPELKAGSYQLRKGRLLCFRQSGRAAEFERELEAVLELSEKYRATIREDESRRAFFAGEQEVFDAAVADALARGDARRAHAFAEESRARSLLDFVKSGRTIAEVEREFASAARPLALAEIQARLPEQAQVVQYAVLPDRLAVWVLTRTRFELFERPVGAGELAEKVAAYQASVAGRAADARAARELYELLVPPGLESGKQLCLIPDKSLHQLAFASLVSPAGKYLLEEFALFQSPSASVMALATEQARRRQARGDERLLSVGNPDFDREENPRLADLRAAGEEARAVAAGYGRARELLGAAATKESFLRHFADVEVVHFAGHFVANRRSPGHSKLLFAGGEVRAAELGAYRLPRAKLVVLSACETGFERYDQSEGAVGVARTFLALGAPLVVASQWQVDSEPTRDLMVAFHRHRRASRLTSAESLRRAQLEALARDATREPFYWAAFTLFGGHTDY